MEKKEVLKICGEIKKEKYSLLSKTKIDELDLQEIATVLQSDEQFNIGNLFNIILHNQINEHCDWNIGSILQHFDYNLISTN